MTARVQNYHAISCGCCTGRLTTIAAEWGEYEMRVDKCVCWMHQDPWAPGGLPAQKCSKHGSQRPAGVEYEVLP